MGDESPRPLVLYDGVCALCSRTVRFLLRVDRRRRLVFAPLQGATAAPILARHELGDGLDTLVLVRHRGSDRERVEIRSGAALSVLALTGGPWRLLTALRLVPRPLRDWLYDRVAANRYRWFGRYDTCRLPSPDERDRFLD